MAKRKKRSDYHVYLQGHCHHIGDGLRGVQFIKQGRKWVYFRETATGFTCKVLIPKWDRLVERAYRSEA